MALSPIDQTHALQILAGTQGRNAGHGFEDSIAKRINLMTDLASLYAADAGHLFVGDPGELLVRYIVQHRGIAELVSVSAVSTGALATSEKGKQWLSVNGLDITRCKSDLVVTLCGDGNTQVIVGVSTKQCNNPKPTNAQLFFTTARGFAALLRSNGIAVSEAAQTALRQFCGDVGYRPMDVLHHGPARQVDPRRWFWEEIDPEGRAEWARLFTEEQDAITRLLLTKGYEDDPFPPEFLVHKTKHSPSWEATEVAIFSIDELVSLSNRYQGFATRGYSVKKGSHRDPPGVIHEAPRFGVVQMQRGGQRQHPEQLQFNLEAGYFYKL